MILNKQDIQRLGLQSGDIFAVKGRGPASWLLRNCITPPSDRFHFGLVWMPTEDGNDRVILESQGEGTWLETILDIALQVLTKQGAVGQAVAVGRLSFYDGQDLEFYRPTQLDKRLRRQAPGALTCYGRDGYGYAFVAKLVVRGLWKWATVALHKRHFRRLRVEEIPYVERTKALICTVAADMGYCLLGHNLIPLDITATPNAYAQLLLDGALERIELKEAADAVHTAGTTKAN